MPRRLFTALLPLLLLALTARAIRVWNNGCPYSNPCLTYTCAPGYQCFNTGPGERECFDPETGTYSEIQTLTHVIGSGSEGPSSDGVGTAATVRMPVGMVAVHGTERDFLVTDIVGITVCYVRGLTGEVTSIAGRANTEIPADGVGTAVSFGRPGGMAYAAATGLYYVADDNRVRWIQLSSGNGWGPATVGTLAGGGDYENSPFIDGPPGVATMGLAGFLLVFGSLVVHADGLRMFAVEEMYGSVREISLATGVVTTRKGIHPNTINPFEPDTCVLGMASGGAAVLVGNTLFTSSLSGPGAMCALDLDTNTMTLISGTRPPFVSSQNGTTSFTSPAVRAMLPMPDGSILVGDGNTLRKWDKGPSNMPFLTKNDVAHSAFTCVPEFGTFAQSRACFVSGFVRTGDGTVFVALREVGMIARIDSRRE